MNLSEVSNMIIINPEQVGDVFVTEINVVNLKRAMESAGLPFGVNNAIRPKRLTSLAKSKQGSERKFLRFVDVYFKLKAPLSFFVEFDTYKVHCDRMSTSVMHTILKTGLRRDNFSNIDTTRESLDLVRNRVEEELIHYVDCIIEGKNENRITDSTAITLIKDAIPGSFYYTSEIKINYETLRNMIADRTGHRLKYWDMFLNYFKELPYYEEFLI